MKKFFLLLLFFALIFGTYTLFFNPTTQKSKLKNINNQTTSTKFSVEDKNDQKDSEKLLIPSKSKTLKNNYHVYQTFNNCGPSSLSMALSYFNIKVSQKELGQQLRPYQHPDGDNDDKSVTMKELAEKSKDYGFVPYYRPNGNIEIIKYAITYDIPVITKTWLAIDDDTGHYRVVKGYNENRGVIIQDDSMQGKNLQYTYEEFNQIWKKFNYEYLLLVPTSKVETVEQFLGKNANESMAWELAVTNAKNQLANNPNDIDARFNLVVALHNTQEYEEAIVQYEKIEQDIKLKRLWYQIEPLNAYYQVGNYDKVLDVSKNILENGNRAYSELYLLRGNIYEKRDNLPKAKEEYEKALFYNKNLKSAINAQL